jgi:C-terminal peptidase prc
MSAKESRLVFAALLIAFSLLFLFQKGFLPGSSPKYSDDKNLNLLNRVISHIRNDYIEEPNPALTMEGAFKGLVNSLDPLSGYLDKKNVAKFLELPKTAFEDVGMILSKRYGLFPQVAGLIENSSASRAGIQLGDSISALDGQSTLAMSLVETNLYLKDNGKKPVRIKVLRDNDTWETTVARAPLFPEPFAFIPQKNTAGILTIHNFFPPCTSEIGKKVFPLLKRQQAPLILDLRNCSEGDVEEARKFMNFFVKAEKVGYFEKKGGAQEPLACRENAALEPFPLVIWTSQATSGTAEMVAAVLREFRKCKIIGLPTPGLASKQELFNLEDGSGLLLTSGVFVLNSGTKVWGRGVLPDEKVEESDLSTASYLQKTLALASKL